MAWFKRKEKGIQTTTEEKKDIPKGLWYKSPTGKIVDSKELEKNYYVSPEDGYHVRIGSKEYFEILFDDNKFKELDENLTSKDPLKFVDNKKYPDRLKAAKEKTNLKDAVRFYGKRCRRKNCTCRRLCLKEKITIHDYFKIWWRTYDGSSIVFNATSQDII